jgi:nucleotide-binding universal stress UspA family protein
MAVPPAFPLPMFRHILVALDGGPQAPRVLALAASLAGPQTRFQLLCVVDAGFDTGTPAGSALRAEYAEADLQQRAAERLLDTAAGELRARGLEVYVAIAAGEPAARICEQATTRDCDLIVIGHRHLSRLQRLFETSTGADVIEHAGRPVLVETREAR